MGTDIHLYVETRDRRGVWSAVKLPAPDGHEEWHDGYRGWDKRYYDVFSILAGVRNGHGFAGIPTGAGFIPISEPRGLPPDLSVTFRSDPAVLEDERTPDIGEHSFSWLLLSELLAYDWTQTTTVLEGDYTFNRADTRTQRTMTYRECAKSFLEWVDGALVPLGRIHGNDCVRIVFGFDS
jgi:hypothetical protein